jgi:peptidyl-tRNA hydrolase, PTH1 family
MKLIVGLGNPGDKYDNTKHNLGFMVLDQFLKDAEPVNKSNWSREEKLKSDIYVFEWKPKKGEAEKVILAKPLTYMNNSGMAVRLIADFYKIKPEDLWIIHDELDLPLGTMKIRMGGASAGHHGVDSVIEKIGTDKFWRFRMGIGFAKNHGEIARHKVNGQEYVLRNFGRGESSKARTLVKRGAKAISAALEKGMTSSMNQFNTK